MNSGVASTSTRPFSSASTGSAASTDVANESFTFCTWPADPPTDR